MKNERVVQKYSCLKEITEKVEEDSNKTRSNMFHGANRHHFKWIVN